MQFVVLGLQAQLHMDPGPQHVVVVAPAETSDATRFDLYENKHSNVFIHALACACVATLSTHSSKFTALYQCTRKRSVRLCVRTLGCRLTSERQVLESLRGRSIPQKDSEFATENISCAVTVACTCCVLMSDGTVRSHVCTRSVLAALRTFFSLYDNLFTVPCCACGDLL